MNTFLLFILAVYAVFATIGLSVCVVHLKRKCAASRKASVWKIIEKDADLPRGRAIIAYDTHDERKVRYAFGHFQFSNGRFTSFWKDGNEQPKRVERKDVLFWTDVPVLPNNETESKA